MKKGVYLVATIIVLAGILSIFQLGCSDPPLPPPFIYEPDSPGDLTAQVLSSSEIFLEWMDLSVNEEAFEIHEMIADDGIFRFLVSVDAAVDFETDSTMVSVTLTDKIPNTTYYYQVRAINESGGSLFSNIASTTTLHNPPEIVTDLDVVEFTQTFIHIRWIDNAFNEDGYRVDRMSGGLEWATIDTVDTDEVAYTDTTGIEPGETYTYRIIGFNNGGESDPSNELQVTSLHWPPDAPTELRGEGADPGEIRLYWVDNSEFESGFRIDRRGDRMLPWEVLDTVDVDVEFYRDTLDLFFDRQFYYQITAFSTGGNSEPSDDISVPTPGLPAGYTQLKVNAVSSNEALISWEDLSTNEDGFKVSRSIEGGDWEVIGTVGDNDTTYLDPGLMPNTTYSYRVWAFNFYGSSVPNDPISITTLGAPAAFEAFGLTSTRVQLDWDNGSDNRENGYRVQKLIDGEEEWINIADLIVGERTFIDNQVVGNMTYTYRVLAFGDRSISNPTNEIIVHTLVMPQEFRIAPVSDSAVRLYWVDNSESEDGFQIERRATDLEDWEIVGTTLPDVDTHEDAGLDRITTYFYRMSAISSNSMSDYTEELSARTFDTLPLAPSDLAGEVTDRDEITLTWTDNADNESGFVIERKELGGIWVLAATVGANVEMFENNALNPESTYLYRIQAFNSGGNSDWSNEIEIVLILEEITEVIPNHAMQGESLTVELVGYQTHFTFVLDAMAVWLEDPSGEIHAVVLNVIDDESMTIDFDIPVDAVTGRWDLKVDQLEHGVLTMRRAFNIEPAE
ncbi:MAG: fibronectin type III domain-containing protein [Calditrichaeota bacterium]|jgi:uncharacterized protein|nr:fibronectin type III domain-containing protein [Calditrichota bacterium]